ncbi:MAG: GIY-YIG nuclease family protein [Owenweeksia sp.]
MFVVYAISSIKRNYIYVGLTNNLEKRLLRYNRD